MVANTISGTCHHEAYLARVNSFSNFLSVKSTQTLQCKGYRMDSELRIFWFGPPSLIFFKICQMVICPVRRTYNHVSIFLFSSTEKALNYQVEQYLRLLNSHICLEFLSSPRNFNFFREYVRWWQIQSAVHVTTRLIFLEPTHSAIFFPRHRLRHDRLGVTGWILSSISFGSVLLV